MSLVSDTVTHFFYWFEWWLLANLCGLLITQYWLSPGVFLNRSEVSHAWRKSSHTLFILFLINSLAIFFLDLIRLTGEPLSDVLAHGYAVFSTSFYGSMLTLKLFALILLASVIVSHSNHRSNLAWVAAVIAIVLLSFSMSATSHAANQGIFNTKQLVHCLHLLSVLVWVGPILAFHHQLAPLLSPNTAHKKDAINCITRLSKLASISFGITLVTGITLAWYLIVEFTALTDTIYGQRFSIKILFVIGMLWVAFKNRQIVLSKLIIKEESNEFNLHNIVQFKRYIAIDRILIALVLLMASDVAHQIPPSDLSYANQLNN